MAGNERASRPLSTSVQSAAAFLGEACNSAIDGLLTMREAYTDIDWKLRAGVPISSVAQQRGHPHPKRPHCAFWRASLRHLAPHRRRVAAGVFGALMRSLTEKLIRFGTPEGLATSLATELRNKHAGSLNSTKW